MLEIIIGRAGTGKTHYCLESIKKFLASRPLRAKAFLLMPAYMTYKAEHDFAEMTDGAANTYFYSFQRFAKQILIETGGANIPKITEIGRRIILRKILLQRDKNQNLKYFTRAIKQRGFTENLAAAIKELRTYSITADQLRQATANIEDEDLCDKLLDLAVLSEDFREAINGKNYDDEDIIELAAAKIEQSKLVKGAEIFIDGFVFFDPQQRKIINEILKYARNVHITLPMDTDLNDCENNKEIGLFRQSMKTFSTIREIAAKLDVRCEIMRLKTEKPITFQNAKRFKRGALMLIEETLFAIPKNKFVDERKTESIKIIEASNKRVEVEAVAQDILRLHNEKGYKFRDIGILIRDEMYTKLLKPTFEMHEIPFYSDEKLMAIHHPIAELIKSSLEILDSRKSNSIFYCLKTGFFDIERSDIDLLENYVLEFGIKGINSWTSDKDWHWYHRDVADDIGEIKSWEQERLEKVNLLRKRAATKLVDFSSAVDKAVSETKNKIRKSATVRALTEALYALLENLQVPETLAKWSAAAESTGDLVLAREHLRIWDDIINLFEQIVSIMGDEVISVKEFEALINEGVEALKMSLIPQGLDEVLIENLDQNSLQNAKAIYILGCNEGQMPRKSVETGLLSDAERLYINSAGIEIAAGAIENSLAEKFLLYRGFTEAQEYLCISYSLASNEGDEMRRSPLIDDLKNIITNIATEQYGIDILGTNSDLSFIVDNNNLTPKTAMKLFAPYKKLKSSISKLEMFNSCPFRHFAKHGLRIDERKEHKFFAYDLGNLLHAVFKKFGERMHNEKRRWNTVGEEELIKIVEEIFNELVPRFRGELMLSSNTYQHQLERIKRLAIKNLRWLISFDDVSHFHPELFESAFGKANMGALIYNLNSNVKLEITGRIDRIDFDESGKYYLIMDYKTGNAYINLLDMYFGLNLQLLTYILATDEKFEDRVPAGMLYCFIKYPPRKLDNRVVNENEARAEIEEQLKMPGWVLADPDVIRKIDSSFQFIKVGLNKDGGFTERTRQYVKTKKDFDLLLKYIESTLQNTGSKIIGGEIAAKPYKSAKKKVCDYCPYSAVCGFDPSMKNFNWFNIDKIDDKEIMKNIEAKLNN